MLFSPHYSLASVYTVNIAPWWTLVFFMLCFPFILDKTALSSLLQKFVHPGDTCCFSSLRCSMLSFTSDSACIVASLVAQTVRESAHNARDPGSIPGLERSPGEGKGHPLQYSCLENSMDRGAWRATIHGVTRVGHSWAAHTHTHTHTHTECLYCAWILNCM